MNERSEADGWSAKSIERDKKRKGRNGDALQLEAVRRGVVGSGL